MEKEWYVVNTYSGHETKVKEKLEQRAISMGMQDNIFRVIIPETTEVEIKDGVKKEKVKKMFPGYVLVEMIMSDEAWYIVRNTPGVTGFIGSSGHKAKPTPLMPQEIDRILANMGMSRNNIESEMEVGSKVTIIDGPFNGMNGVVDSIDIENNRLNVGNKIFLLTTSDEYKMLDIKGWSRSDVETYAKLLNMNVTFEGYGYVKSYSVKKDTVINRDIILNVTLEPKYKEE